MTATPDPADLLTAFERRRDLAGRRWRWFGRELEGRFKIARNRIRRWRTQDGAAAEGRRTRVLSPLTLRILAVNMLVLLLLALGLLLLDRYQQVLIRQQIAALEVQAQLIAGAVAAEASEDWQNGGQLNTARAQQLVRRLVEPTLARAQLFGPTGKLMIDSLLVTSPGGYVTVLPLPDTAQSDRLRSLIAKAYDWVFNSLPTRDTFPAYRMTLASDAVATIEGRKALQGEAASAVYLAGDGHLVFNVAVPVQVYREVLGVLILSRNSADMDEALRGVRANILAVVAGALLVTVLLSLYLAGTIARPIRRLALAADRVRAGRERTPIPDFGDRNDEIGDLSQSLRAMTTAMYARLEAIERFAADVSHEIKNPLTSVRSAVETAIRVSDPQRRQHLLDLILDDVRRLDRLITDIASASRLDAELARAEPAPVHVGRMLEALIAVHQETRKSDQAPVILETAHGADLTITGIEDRLVQVFRNLLANALSFTPPDGLIRIGAQRVANQVEVVVEDDGPGIPPDKAEAIFERFYSERPRPEKFGLHSGLGLSISRQIIQAHRGSIKAENRLTSEGRVLGARFVLRLPAATSKRG